MSPEADAAAALYEKLNPVEEYWRDHYEWLKDCGYELRPRFRPDWIPSWRVDPTKTAMFCPDSWRLIHSAVIDACRLSDGSNVVLKKVDRSLHPFELEISEFLTGLGKSRENHCIPLLDTLRPAEDPNLVILVLPYMRRYNSPKFDTFGEVVELFRQLFEGLQLMHRHHIAHRDIHSLNILMDGAHLYPHGFQPDIRHQHIKLGSNYLASANHTTRTWKPVKYFLADFGISCQYSASEREGGVLDRFIMGGDKSPPEHQGQYSMVDPFATDVYFLGNFIKIKFIERDENAKTVGFRGFGFMKDLVADMTQDEPSKRPTIDEAAARFAQIQRGLSSWKLRSRVNNGTVDMGKELSCMSFLS
ncbi:Protein kinase domain-containing protein [Mycena chlorophos]|uniref:Protein kinase domain-containing protein n=1 Tax=Mycena chlorophos TaxID=658473 RepID=A0A8H6VWR7_MYCCL|nr:Protein kinase domain-containing protein [Mycena chlorophos]